MTYYQLLGVKRGASQKEIKKGYWEAARKVHPDTAPANATAKQKREVSGRFAEINNAYEVLSDPKRRKAYDTSIGLGRPAVSRLSSRNSMAGMRIGENREFALEVIKIFQRFLNAQLDPTARAGISREIQSVQRQAMSTRNRTGNIVDIGVYRERGERAAVSAHSRSTGRSRAA
jgi:DnaJ-class molecular chaperone